VLPKSVEMTAIRYCTSQVSIAPFETLSYIPTRTVLYGFRNLSVSHKYRWRGGYDRRSVSRGKC
jgi:hypothetical protein